MSRGAELPTEAGLFGQVERAPRERRTGAAVRVEAPPLFDLREGDAPGQVTIEDATEAPNGSGEGLESNVGECSPRCPVCNEPGDQKKGRPCTPPTLITR